MVEAGVSDEDAPAGALMKPAVGSGQWLVAFKGFPGSGKSALSRVVSRQLGWPLIDKDDIKDSLDGHTSEAGALAYNAMFNVARRQLLQGLSVVCDSPLTSNMGYERATRVAVETGAALVVVECRCSDAALWRRRIEARRALGLPAHHKTDWASLQDHLRTATVESSYPIAHPRLVVDTVAPVDDLCAGVIRWLEQQARTRLARAAGTQVAP